METLLRVIDRHLLSINAIILGIIFIPNLYLNYIELLKKLCDYYN